MRDLEAWSLLVPLQPKLHLQGRLYRERWLLSSRFRSHILLGIVSRRERIPLSPGRMRRGLQTLTNSTPINREAAGPATKNLSCYWVKHRVIWGRPVAENIILMVKLGLASSSPEVQMLDWLKRISFQETLPGRRPVRRLCLFVVQCSK